MHTMTMGICKTRGITMKCPFLTKHFMQSDGPDRRALVPHALLLLELSDKCMKRYRMN